jgi:protein ImuA
MTAKLGLEQTSRAAGLRQAIRRIESRTEGKRGRLRRDAAGAVVAGEADAPVLDFGFAPLDRMFRGGGLAAGSHQMAAAVGHEPWAAVFALALAGRLAASALSRPVLLVQASEAEAEHGPWSAEGLRALGLDMDRIGLVRTRTAQAAVQATDEALKSGAVSAVLLEGGRQARIDLSLTRRFNLSAQRSGALALLVGGTSDATSAALTRWRAAPLPSRRRNLNGARPALGPPAFSLTLTRSRLGPLGQWEVEWDCDERIFKPAAPAFPASVAALAAGRAGPPLRHGALPDARTPDLWSAGPGRQAG